MTKDEEFGLMQFANRIEQQLMIALSQLSDAQELAGGDEDFIDRINQAKAIIAEQLDRLHQKSRPR